MRSLMKHLTRHFLLLSALLATAAPTARAQAPEPTIVVVGTTIRSPLDNSHWGYLSWLASRPELLRDRPYAVYLKDGAENEALPFRLVGTVKPQTDPATIKTLFERSRHIGQDPAKLNDSITAYFDQLHPGGGVPVQDMFGALTTESLQNDDIFQMLVFMGRAHPGAALSLGTGFATRIHDGTSTFELREKAPGSNEFTSVVGRVTITAGQPTVFTAPAAPVVVPSTDRNGAPLPSGDVTNHMNVKLRWASPDPLRRQSLLLRGYHVYRVTRDFAEAQGWQNCPVPAPLASLDWDAEVATSFPQVAKVNRLPIMPRRFYNNAEAGDFDLDEADGIKGDLDFYTQDDNRHNGLQFNGDGDPVDSNNIFVPGAEFYYYVVCEDLLGRQGAVSCGTLVKVCDRTPPVAPKKVRVTNDFAFNPATNQSDQRLRVSWQALPDSENAVAYFVYRWRSLPDFKAAQATEPLSLGPEHLVAGPIAHTTGGDTLSVLDQADPTHSPRIGADPKFNTPGDDAGKTIWYSVVAVDNSVCGGNFSPHSAPASGVLRDRVAPLDGGGGLVIRCCTTTLTPGRTQRFSDLAYGLDPERLHFDLVVTREGDQPELIRQAEFWVYDSKNDLTFPLTTADFPASPNTPLSIDASIARPDPAIGTYHLRGKVILADGRSSNMANVDLPNLPDRFQYDGIFEAVRSCQTRNLRPASQGDCTTHEAVADNEDDVVPIEIEMEFAVGTREWRVYRSINNRPPTLARQGVLGSPAVAAQLLKIQDLLFSPAGGEACYFVQYFDEHGNGGPMKELGCVKFTGKPPPTPTLARIKPLVDNGNPKAIVRWFCPTAGIDHFEVHVTRSPGLPPDNLSAALTKDGGTVLKTGVQNGLSILRTGKRYITGLVGGDFNGNGPEFTVTFDQIELDQTFHVAIVAVGSSGLKSTKSNIAEFVWETPEELVLPEVKWPARPLPPITEKPDWDARIEARYLGPIRPGPNGVGLRRVGVRIGQEIAGRSCMLSASDFNVNDPLYGIPGNFDPLTRVFTKGDWTESPGVPPPPRLLPGMLYRYQVANALFDEVSNDIVQVTPLMETIAHVYQQPVGGANGPMPNCNGIRIYDPHIAVTGLPGPDSTIAYDLWLLDSMPVVLGARYAYLLVVFNDQGEIRTVVPAGEVEIPLTP